MRCHRWRRFLLVVCLTVCCLTFTNLLLHDLLHVTSREIRHHDVIQNDVSYVDNNKQLEHNGCDSECRRFHAVWRSWPSAKPRAVIYYLVHSKTLHKLNASMQFLDQNFNNKYEYPVVVFVDEDLNSEHGRSAIQSMTQFPSRLFIQIVHFVVPTFLSERVPVRAGNGKSIGYRHMCRFHAKTVYEQAIMNTIPPLQFAWRLDDDSYLYQPVQYDVINAMDTKHIQYGYIQIRDESPRLIRGLWETVDTYLQSNNIPKTEFYNKWRHTRIYYTNFELSDMNVWMSSRYKQLIEHIDRQGGIYYYRWGDAPIKTIAVTLFVNESQTHKFSDIPYKHDRYTNRGVRQQ